MTGGLERAAGRSQPPVSCQWPELPDIEPLDIDPLDAEPLDIEPDMELLVMAPAFFLAFALPLSVMAPDDIEPDIDPFDIAPDDEPDMEPLLLDWAKAGALIPAVIRARAARVVIVFIALSCVGRSACGGTFQQLEQGWPGTPGVICDQLRAAATIAPPGPACTNIASLRPACFDAGMA